MSKLFIIVALLVGVGQCYESNGATTQGVDYYCSRDGYMPHPTDFHEYYQCEWITGTGWHLHLRHCPAQTAWNQTGRQCDDSQCSRDGFMPNPTDPREFFQCKYIPGRGWLLILKQCPQQTTWDQAHKICDGSPQPTTQNPIDVQCSRDGFVPNPKNSSEYYQCEYIPGQGWNLIEKHCPQQTTWVQAHKKCDVK